MTASPIFFSANQRIRVSGMANRKAVSNAIWRGVLFRNENMMQS
jgi:hypothetical protein